MSDMDDTHAFRKVSKFLGHEAWLLDSGAFEEWYALLDDELEYTVAITMAHAKRNQEIPANAYRLRDTKQMVRVRLDRMNTGLGFAELPESRTVRAVSSLHILDVVQDIVTATNVLTLYRHRGTDQSGDTLFVRRNDKYRLGADGVRLLSRQAILAEAVMSTPNLGIFL